MLGVTLIYLFKHVVFLHKLVVRGERVLHHHPLLEASLVYALAWMLLTAEYGVVL